MQTQIITESGTVIGIYDPKDDQEHITHDSEISKATLEDSVGEGLKGLKAKIEAKAAANAPKPKKTLRAAATDVLPKTRTGKVALVGIPATAALLASETNRGKVRTKYQESRDVRHYRPASVYYDDGFGKAWVPKWMGSPAKSKTMAGAMKGRTSVPRAVHDKLRPVGQKLADAATSDANLIPALGLAATGVTAAAGSVKAARAARKAAKRKMLADIQRRQNIRDAAVVGAVAAPVALGARALSNRKSDVEKGMVSEAGKKLKKVITQAADPVTQKKVSGQIADMSGDAARTATNVRSVVNDAKQALIPNYKQKGGRGLSTGQKVALGGAGVGGLLVGRELSGPKPYPYQQQR